MSSIHSGKYLFPILISFSTSMQVCIYVLDLIPHLGPKARLSLKHKHPLNLQGIHTVKTKIAT